MDIQQITVSDQQPKFAVQVDDLYLGYNQTGNVLKGVQLNVKPASIYGLLGKFYVHQLYQLIV